VSDGPGLATQLVAQHGGKLGFTYTRALKGFSARLPDQALAALQRNPQIERIETDQVVRGADTQTSPPSWGLDRIDQRARPLDDAYAYPNAGTGVSVYILDTGIRSTHVDFGGRVLGGFTSIGDGTGTNDCHGHGTHVAGIVGGKTFGVAKAVKLYSVRVLDCSGSGSISGIVAGIDWIVKNRQGPSVANMSMSGAISQTLNTAVQNGVKAGVTFVVAAGNNNGDACNYSPGNTPEALTIGNSWNGDGRSGTSNYGPCVDVFAPGDAIRSAGIADDTVSVLKSGTSMASPHAAGVAALYLSANPNATPAQVAQAIVSNATRDVLASIPTGTVNLLLYSGFNAVSAPPPPTDTATPPPPSPDTTTTPTPLPTASAPVASFTASCGKQPCLFDGSKSISSNGALSFQWEFGDGASYTSGSSPKYSHTYKSKGSYTVTLTVTDAAGLKGKSSKKVQITKP
jgi:subtilisin family serine protease